MCGVNSTAELGPVCVSSRVSNLQSSHSAFIFLCLSWSDISGEVCSVNMSYAQVRPPAVSSPCIDRESRATLTYSAASQSSDTAENEFFKPLERRAAELEPSQMGSWDQSTA